MKDSVASEALVMPSSTGCSRADFLPSVFDALVDVQRTPAVQLLTAQQRGLARVQHLGLAQHLADDHLDVLVVDLHTLQPVHVLDLAHQVVGQRLDALQAQDVVRVRLTVRDDFAALDGFTLEHVQLPPLRDQLLVLRRRPRR